MRVIIDRVTLAAAGSSLLDTILEGAEPGCSNRNTGVTGAVRQPSLDVFFS